MTWRGVPGPFRPLMRIVQQMPSGSSTPTGSSSGAHHYSLFHPFRELGQPSSHKRKSAYTIGEKIGAGEFGEVKLAVSNETGDLVAIKIVSKSNYTSVTNQAVRLNAYQGLNHPGVLKLYEWFESRERFYFVLQFMAGGELYDVVESRGHLPEDETRELVSQLLDALAYLHRQLVIHRDLKLENLLTDESHRHVVIADMGLSVRLEHPDQKVYARCGSLGYTAPEVYSDARPGYSTPVDIWSIGVCTFIMLGGRFPFIGSTPQEVAAEGLAGRIRFTSGLPWAAISDQGFDFIRGLLNPDPAARLTAAQALEHPWIKMKSDHPFADKATSEHVENSAPASAYRQSFKEQELAKAHGDTAALTLRRTITHRDEEMGKLVV